MYSKIMLLFLQYSMWKYVYKYINFSIYIYLYISSIYTVYKADVSNNKTDEHKYYYCISDTPFKERYEKHETSFRHRSHLTASDLSKYYWKLVDNDAVLTIKFSIAKRVKGNTFISNYNLCLSKKAFIIRNLDDVNMLNNFRIYIKVQNLYQSVDI